MELIRPMKQKVWGWPAVANFILGGMATGFYLLSLLVAGLWGGASGVSQPAVFKLLAPALVSLGFLTLIFEAGRPLRGHHLVRHLGRSWMSRETLAGVIFVPLAILDWLFPHLFLWGLAAVGAVGLLISQGFIVYRARAVTAWNVSLMPLLFLSSGFATGSGLLLLVDPGLLDFWGGPVLIGVIWAVLNLVVWLLYLRWSHDAAFQAATEALRRPNSLILTVGIGHLLPVFLLLVFAGGDVGPEGEFQRIVATLAGLALVIGGVSQKTGIILEAGYLRGIVLGQPKGNARGASRAYPISSPAVGQGDLPRPIHPPYHKTLQTDGEVSE